MLFRPFFRLLAILVLSFSMVAAAGIGILIYFNAPPSTAPGVEGLSGFQRDADGTPLLELRSGESAYAVGKRLEQANFIRTSLLWNLLARLDKEYLKAGLYRIEGRPTQMELRTLLVSGKQVLVRVTIPEGATLKKTAAILESAGVGSAEDFLAAAGSQTLLRSYAIPAATMEGYLYPDTYLFPRAYPAEMVVRAMADNFFKRLKALVPEALDYSPEQLFQRVIVASIVEREYRASDEAPLMAGVFYNRLRIGMAFQSCATVAYVITEILGKPHPEVIYNRDLEIKNPYNTYLHRGLPPGPISSPGAVALEAAFRPASNDFLYFVLVDPKEGRHRFSRTLDDHNRAAYIYVKQRAAAR